MPEKKAKRNTLLIDWCTMFQILKNKKTFSLPFSRLCCIRPRRWFNPNENKTKKS
jgi:hypothetical protein